MENKNSGYKLNNLQINSMFGSFVIMFWGLLDQYAVNYISYGSYGFNSHLVSYVICGLLFLILFWYGTYKNGK